MSHLNPVYKRELKQTARTKKMLIMLCCYNLLLAALGFFAFYLTFDQGTRLHTNQDFSRILTLYTVMLALEFVMVVFIVPAATSGSIAGEREKQTLDILLSTRISPLQIVAGKLAASISMIILLVVSSLPVLAIVYSVGGIVIFDMLQFIVFIVVTTIFLGSIGIFFSVICRKTTGATVSSYAVTLLVTFLFPVFLYFGKLIRLFNEGGAYSFARLSSCVSGKRSILLLLNPMTSFIALIRGQVGRGITYMSSIGQEGGVLYLLSKNWFGVSMLCQLLAAAVLLMLAAHKLNPISGGRRAKKKAAH